jgi:hypothetical protein
MRETLRSVRIAKQTKKICADCAVCTVRMDADMAHLYDDVACLYTEVADGDMESFDLTDMGE